MDTMTTVDAYERTPSGAHKLTLGGAVAGTFDDEIGALAERLAGEGAEANPVAVVLEVQNGKTFVKAMREITAPEALDGPAEEPPAVGPEAAKLAPEGETLDSVLKLDDVSDEALLEQLRLRLIARRVD